MQIHRVPALIFMAVILVTVGSSGCQPQTDHQPSTATEFALIGDTPYGVLPGGDYAPFDQLIADINADPRIQWVMHAGDIKLSITPCSDAMFQDRLRRFNQFRPPLILTPGDNEWTDCHRHSAGHYQPLERLTQLRKTFYPQPGTVTLGGQSMQVHSQANTTEFANYPENIWWLHDRVIYSAIHMVGSNNGKASFQSGSKAQRTQADDDEVSARTQAALAMLQTVFAEAKSNKAAGIFIMIHANPSLEKNRQGSKQRGAYLSFLETLEQQLLSFPNPVVLAHGDSHYFRIDQPPLITQKFLPNFTRVETYGFPNAHHWIRVRVQPDSASVFSFQQERIAAVNTNHPHQE
jgi:hypothetical protein